MDRAWANASKGLRQCQKADEELDEGDVDAASKHYNKALEYFSIAADHLQKAENQAYAKAGSLVDDGNRELQKAIDKYADGDVDGAEKHYEKALEKYDEALNEIP